MSPLDWIALLFSKAKYIRGLNLIARETDGERQYYLFNAHGDVVQALVEGTGNLWYHDYDANVKYADFRDSDAENVDAGGQKLYGI